MRLIRYLRFLIPAWNWLARNLVAQLPPTGLSVSKIFRALMIRTSSIWSAKKDIYGTQPYCVRVGVGSTRTQSDSELAPLLDCHSRERQIRHS